MKVWHLIPLFATVFLSTLLVSSCIVQVQTGDLSETRESALVSTLKKNQLSDGSFTYVDINSSVRSVSTAIVLHTLRILNADSTVDYVKALDYLYSMQNMTSGNSTLWGWPQTQEYDVRYNCSDLGSAYEIVECLKLFNGSLNAVNRQGLLGFVIERYNWSDGAFHEPLIKLQTPYGEEWDADCSFFLTFPGGINFTQYANSNMISTFLGVSVLADLNALDLINRTRTLNWILSCEDSNGAFRPFPGSAPNGVPGWSRFATNPFWVDGNGTGLAFTYAALGALRGRKYVNGQPEVDRKE